MKQLELFDNEEEFDIEEAEKFILEMESTIQQLEEQENFFKENNAFDWALEFPQLCDEQGNWEGFDVVVGNPPYIDFREVKKEVINYLSDYKINFKSPKINLYQYFIEKGFNLLKNNGILCFINPNQFLTIDSGFGTRKFLIENTKILFINDVSYLKVFDSAATYTAVWAFEKKIEEDYKIKYNKCKVLEDLNKNQHLINKTDVLKTNKLSIIAMPEYELIRKIENNTLKLGEICEMAWGTSKSGYGKLKITQNKFENLKQEDQNQYAKILQTRDIKKFYIDWKLEYIPKNIYTQNIIKKFQVSEKILIARMTLSLQAAIDTEQCYVGKSTLISNINSNINSKYLLAILNSKLIDFWYKNYFENTHMAGGYMRFDIPYLKQIPIKSTTKAQQNGIIKLVDKLGTIKNKDIKVDTKDLEKQINLEVYKLYNLTKDEIKIIEK